MPRPCESFQIDVDAGFSINAWHWKAVEPSNKGPVLFVHATGFHGRVWNQVIDRIVDRDVYAIDSPGHGLSSNLQPPFQWQQFADLLKQFLVKTGLKDLTAVGHSMGGHLLTLIAAELDIFEKLILLDPIILPMEAIKMSNRFEEMGIKEHPTAKRRNQWSSPEEMYENFSQREPFIDWKPEVVKDYCQWGLVPVDDHFELACPPSIESAIYLSSGGERVYDAIPDVKIPVEIVRGRPRTPEDPPFDFRPSPVNPELASLFPNATDRVLMDNTHFFPFEDPQLVADLVNNS